MAITALILGIVSWVMCGPFVSIPGLIVAKMELGKIERGESPQAGETLAKVGFWVSLANVVITVLVVCAYFAFIGVIVGASAASSPH